MTTQRPDDLNPKMKITTRTTSTPTKTTLWTTIGYHRHTGLTSTSHTTHGYPDTSTQGTDRDLIRATSLTKKKIRYRTSSSPNPTERTISGANK